MAELHDLRICYPERQSRPPSPFPPRDASPVMSSKQPEGPRPVASTEGMAWIPAGHAFLMEARTTLPDAGCRSRPRSDPRRLLAGQGLEVTNRQFARFVASTGYVDCCRASARDAEGVSRCARGEAGARLVGLHPASRRKRCRSRTHLVWWSYVPGADWRHPEGPGTAPSRGRMDYPVVQVCWDDADGLCPMWGGKRLAHRSGMGIRRRAGAASKGPAVSSGVMSCKSRWQVAGQHLARPDSPDQERFP